MSGIYIPGMEMPTSCEDCPMAFAVNFGILCTPTKRIVSDGDISKKQGFCPLVPVPPHGDLIDMDALRHWILTEMASLDTKEDREFVADRLANELPTIIPADKED